MGMKGRTKSENRPGKTVCLFFICSITVLCGNIKAWAEIPEHYQNVKENVTFDCPVIVPEELKEEAYPIYEAEILWDDKESEEELFLAGKKIEEKHELEASEFVPASTFYMLSDGTRLGAGAGLNYFISTANFYSQMGLVTTYDGAFERKELEMGGPEKFIQQTEEILEKIGYPADSYRFQWESFDREQLENLERQQIADNLIDLGDEKGNWTREDEVYILYAWQYEQGIPVLTELMGFDWASCTDRVENAPVRAIYSSRGLECINISKHYSFRETGERLPLLEFEKAVQTVEEKLNSILGENQYLVTEAKLFERVKRNKEQTLDTEPVWRFTVSENDAAYFTVLVNAITGEESYFNEKSYYAR